MTEGPIGSRLEAPHRYPHVEVKVNMIFNCQSHVIRGRLAILQFDTLHRYCLD